MNLLNLISEEIRSLYPANHNQQIEDINNTKYVIHCSSVFADALMKNLSSIGFFLLSDPSVDFDEVKIETLKLPLIGSIEIKIDKKQGYKIEKQC